jgi:phenylacetic acid degradation operon negative regulatory protein
MSLKSSTEHLVSEFRTRPTMRAGSLIVTVFGDAVLPRGGTVWIGSLINALTDFGINERLVRTSVFRLTRDHWLEVAQVGRRSYYSLSESGARKFELATARIYGDPHQTWPGDWYLVMLADLEGDSREAVRKELGWLGFGSISPNVLAHPTPDVVEMEAMLKRSAVDQKVVVMRGRTLDKKQDATMRAFVHKNWNLDEIDQRYAAFVGQFQPVLRAVQKSRRPDERLAFQIRTLLIHEYRSILLRDPLLPVEMLPAGWNGTAAYQLCQKLYRRIHVPADGYINEVFETFTGPLPGPARAFFNRFGGLDRTGK